MTKEAATLTARVGCSRTLGVGWIQGSKCAEDFINADHRATIELPKRWSVAHSMSIGGPCSQEFALFRHRQIGSRQDIIRVPEHACLVGQRCKGRDNRL